MGGLEVVSREGSQCGSIYCEGDEAMGQHMSRQPSLSSFRQKIMESGIGRRFSTVTQVNPSSFRRASNDRRGSIVDDDKGRKFTATFGNLALFKNDDGDGPPASFISAYTTPGPKEKAISEHKKANLGVMLGVYLPTIQHILGVTMFIRLFWVVGLAGLWHTCAILAICCSCTLLTSISLSAVATNGVVESGGAYFMISRNLGAEFGSAVGILFYLANTVASSMYLVGGVEVLLMYIWPELTIGGHEAHTDTTTFGMMTNNYRIWGTIFLIIEVLIVAMGVKFVQLLAPVSLVCVILALTACFAGGVEKAIMGNGQLVCTMDDRLLRTHFLFKQYENEMGKIGNRTLDDACQKHAWIGKAFCDHTKSLTLPKEEAQKEDNEAQEICSEFARTKMAVTPGFPGFNFGTLKENLDPSYMGKNEALPGKKGSEQYEVVQDVTVTFFVLMAIYFPAVTGIMTGANMSGDLKDPQKSIPTGTIAATASTSLIYFALAVLFAASIDRSVLRDKTGRSIDDQMVVAALAWPNKWVVTIGSFLSTFGAALQCLCSAPRLLQSIAKDDVIPTLRPFARVTKNNEPFLGLMLTAFIAECAILLGAVDSIAEVLDFFFLMCYAFVNLICFMHSIMRAPNWRPRFKYYHWSLSLLGAFLCFFIMFASRWEFATIACAMTFAIYKYVEWKGAKKEWGDGIRGLALTTAQYSLMKVEDADPHPKNWRPQLLICLSAQWSKHITDNRAVSLIHLGGQLKAGRGLAIACAFLKGNPEDPKDKSRSLEVKQRVQKDMDTARLKGFGKALFYSPQQLSGVMSAVFQAVGIGGLRPNTVLVNWPNFEDHDEVFLFAEELIHGVRNENCVIVAKGITDFPDYNERLSGYIDIWWVVQDGGILMLIAYLMQQHKVWKSCTLRVFAISETDEQKSEEMRVALQKYIYMLRIDAELFIVNLLDEEISEDVHSRVAEMEAKRKELRECGEIHRSRSTGGFINEGYNNDDTLYGKIHKQKLLPPMTGKPKQLSPISINISEDEETTFSDNQPEADHIETSFFHLTVNGTPTATISSQTTIAEKLYEKPTEDNGSVDPKDLKLNIHKMNTSVRLNNVILENSPNSQLVLLNLPHPPRSREAFIHSYTAYLDVLTENLKRVLFIGGSGKEVISIAS
ncbi:unnamed protein product, partial [Mesorhabditis belari]|uniref:Uncharacterized protein n=1 Tax=Mesorhabditis belari TaxID=2138241 RepID=A0AAF3FH94_9BILA